MWNLVTDPTIPLETKKKPTQKLGTSQRISYRKPVADLRFRHLFLEQYSSTYLLLAAVQGTAHSRNTRSTIGYSSHMIQNSPLVPPQHIYTQQRARVVRHTHDAGAAARRALVVTRRAGAAAPAIC